MTPKPQNPKTPLKKVQVEIIKPDMNGLVLKFL